MQSIAPWVEPGGFMAIMALLWTLRRDIAGLREQMARLEGSVDALTKLLIDREHSFPTGKA